MGKLSPEIKRMGWEMSAAKARERAGIPEDAPRNKHGQSCKEKICVVCGKPFLAQWSKATTRKTCSFECGNVLKRTKYQKRKGTGNPNYRHGGRSGVRDREGERRWYAALGPRCENPACAGPKGLLALHHLVYRQTIRREGGDEWDPRNALTLCASCHSLHHRRSGVIELSALPDSAFEYAAELLGSGRAFNQLRRSYGGEDPRLDRLLDT